MVRNKPNIQNKHFNYDPENEEFECKTCGSTYSEMDAIMHLMEEHEYNHIDIILDEPKDD